MGGASAAAKTRGEKYMGFIQDSDKPAIKKALDAMRAEVTLSCFTQEIECDFCRETRELLEELCAIEDRIKLRIFDFKGNPAEVEQYGIDKIPAIAVANGNDSRIRFYGIPAGYEFSSLIQTVLMVSQGDSGLAPESKKLLKEIKAPVHLQVFVTPT
jgi:glutaredoxin-like protein